MADHYTEIMQEAIREVHPQLNDDQFLNNYDDNTLWDWNKFYEYISYRGLRDTEAGSDFFSNDDNNISFYQTGTEANSIKNRHYPILKTTIRICCQGMIVYEVANECLK